MCYAGSHIECSRVYLTIIIVIKGYSLLTQEWMYTVYICYIYVIYMMMIMYTVCI